MSRHLEAIEKLCFVCGQIIKKNSHSLSDKSLVIQMSERYCIKDLAEKVAGNKVPTKICHACFVNLRYYSSQRSLGKKCVTNQFPLPWNGPSNSPCVCFEYDKLFN